MERCVNKPRNAENHQQPKRREARGEAEDDFSLSASRKKIFRTSSPQNYESIHFCSYKLPYKKVASISYGSLTQLCDIFNSFSFVLFKSLQIKMPCYFADHSGAL